MRGDTFSPWKSIHLLKCIWEAHDFILLWPMQDGSEFFLLPFLGHLLLISNRDDFQFFLYSPTVNKILCYCLSLFVSIDWRVKLCPFFKMPLKWFLFGTFKMSPLMKNCPPTLVNSSFSFLFIPYVDVDSTNTLNSKSLCATCSTHCELHKNPLQMVILILRK